MSSVHQVLQPGRSAKVAPGLCALGIMTKAPRAGRVKTRLTPPLTADEAAALNVCFLRDTSAALARTAAHGKAQGVGVYTPAGEEDAFADILPSDFALVLQRGEAFGDRLIAAAEDLFALGYASICLINSDSPTVPTSAYAQAVEWLAAPDERIVLGPSEDGGYYLIGLNRMRRRLFEEITWSTEKVFAQTLERAQEVGVEVKLLPTGFDVDDRSTLRRLCDEVLETGGPPVGAEAAPATRAFLQTLIAREGRGRIWPHA